MQQKCQSTANKNKSIKEEIIKERNSTTHSLFYHYLFIIGKSKMSNEEALRDFERIHAIEMEKAGKGPIPVTYKNNPKLKKKKQLDRQSVKL